MLGFSIIIGLILIIGLGLSFIAQRLDSDRDSLVDRINLALPGMQCGQCGYAGCRPYAQAIVKGEAEINQCPPGGTIVITSLAKLLNNPVTPPDSRFGTEKPAQLAVINEAKCIGCALCLPACPVDAIIGAPDYMHTVINADCTGCELCVAPCPVDCIQMVPVPTHPPVPILQITSDTTALPCIRCNRCSTVCPVRLPAQTLYHKIKQGNQCDTDSLELVTQCIECGLCEASCPSHIPLLGYYQFGKRLHNYQHNARKQARYNRERYENKQKRQKDQETKQQEFWNKQRNSLKMQLYRSDRC